MNERSVHPDVKALLVNNKPHQYAHLIKFERPSRPDLITGLVSTSAVRYTYLTDASRNVVFDDGSTDLQGVANGPQTYLANKLLEVGNIQEQTEATTSTMNIVLDGNCIGAILENTTTCGNVNATTWDITIAANTSPIHAGFREGDKVVLTNAQGTYTVNIHSFRANNVVRVSKIDQNLVTWTNLSTTMTLASEEVLGILLDKTAEDYSSFINREVFIYRAYFENGILVGAPVLVFKGIINRTGFEDADKYIRVSWGLTSHWGDFSKVKGRVTSDSFHRALDENGVPQPQSTLKPIYAYDKGFMHSETSINMLSTYVVQVEKQKIKTKSGFLGTGLFGKVKVKSYFVPEDRHTDLDFQLQAKSIPLIYGVRTTEGIPVFADTLVDDSSTVYVIFALCEGEIGGIYDIYIDGNSLICNDKADYDARHEQTPDNTVELICRGRADAGDVLAASMGTGTQQLKDYYIDYLANWGIDYLNGPLGLDVLNSLYNSGYLTPQTFEESTTADKIGLTHGDVLNLTTPQEIELEIFSGTSYQKASPILVDLSANNRLKIQNSYWENNNTEEYWGPNHRLLDTAYILGKFKIAEGSTSIPELEFIVKGKSIQCYNYDYSYQHSPTTTGENADNFNLFDRVNICNMSGTILHNNVQIIDKWTFRNTDGTLETRFRFEVNPNLGYTNGVPTVTKFYMTKGSGINWTMVTYNHVEFTGTVSAEISSSISSISNDGGKLRINFTGNTNMPIEGDPYESSPNFSVINADKTFVSDLGPFNNAALTGTVTSSGLTTKYDYGLLSGYNIVGKSLASVNTVKLSAAASSINDFYLGMRVRVTKRNAVTGNLDIQEADIIGYDGASKIATVGSLWTFIPEFGNTVEVLLPRADERVSINPAVQLLDYVTSKIYGRGLEANKDLDLPSWLETARKCDSRSDITIKLSGGTAPALNSVYKYPASGQPVWQGVVSKVDGQYITFTNVIGKLTNKWNTWKAWKVGDLVYNDGFLRRMTVAGVTANHTQWTTNSVAANSEVLTRVSTTGPATLAMDATGGNPIKSLRNGKIISGYSLYDSDGVNYWRLAGWDSQEQRNVTRYQTNLIIDTSAPLLENTNSLLQHFNGIMRYTAGKYYLAIEEQEPAVPAGDIRNISSDDIVGRIQLSDEGVRSAFNSLTAAFPDPGNKFEARNISFFNSDYLKADRNVPKKGNLTLPGITNYYNTRLLADSFLNKSRFGLTISCTLIHHGILLLAGTVIELTYPRYKWDNKPFRITSINYQPNGMVDIVASEYDDSFYSINRISRAEGSGITGKTDRIVAVGPPMNLRVTSADTLDELYNGVELIWENHPEAVSPNCFTEVYGSRTPELYLEINTILAGSILRTLEAEHHLIPGMPLWPVTRYGDDLLLDQAYYVRETTDNRPSLGPNEFTLSLDKKNISNPGDLPPLLSITPGTSIGLKMRTGALLSTVAVPGSTYVDLASNEDTGRVEKYYWIRHKVVQ